MNKKIVKLARNAGFCIWGNESWKPNGAIIDWASNYDKQFINYTKGLLKSVAKKNGLDYNILLQQFKLNQE